MNPTLRKILGPDLLERLDEAALTTGLLESDIIRYAVRRTVSEIEGNGGLIVTPWPAPPSQKPQRGRVSK